MTKILLNIKLRRQRSNHPVPIETIATALVDVLVNLTIAERTMKDLPLRKILKLTDI